MKSFSIILLLIVNTYTASALSSLDGLRTFNGKTGRFHVEYQESSICDSSCICPVNRKDTLKCHGNYSVIEDGCKCCWICPSRLGEYCDTAQLCGDKLSCDFKTKTCRQSGGTMLSYKTKRYMCPSKLRNKRWTPCSKTCGVGFTSRIVFNGLNCKSKKEVAKCISKPCPNDVLENRKRFFLEVNGCRSVKPIRKKSCEGCQMVEKWATKWIDFTCFDGTGDQLPMLFRYPRKCRCSAKFRELN